MGYFTPKTAKEIDAILARTNGKQIADIIDQLQKYSSTLFVEWRPLLELVIKNDALITWLADNSLKVTDYEGLGALEHAARRDTGKRTLDHIMRISDYVVLMVKDPKLKTACLKRGLEIRAETLGQRISAVSCAIWGTYLTCTAVSCVYNLNVLKLSANKSAYLKYHSLKRPWKVKVGGYALDKRTEQILSEQFSVGEKSLREEAEGRIRTLIKSPRVRERKVYAYYLPLVLEFIDFIQTTEVNSRYTLANSYNVSKVLAYLIRKHDAQMKKRTHWIPNARLGKHFSCGGTVPCDGALYYTGLEEQGTISVERFRKAEKEHGLVLTKLIKFFEIPVLDTEGKLDRVLSEITVTKTRSELKKHREDVLRLIKLLKKKGLTKHLNDMKLSTYALFYFVIDIKKRIKKEHPLKLNWNRLYGRNTHRIREIAQYYFDLEAAGKLKPEEFLE